MRKKKRSSGRLKSVLNRMTYLFCLILVIAFVWLATTRPSTLFFFGGTSSLLRCELNPMPTTSRDADSVEYPHFHVPTDALLATATTINIADGTDRNFVPRIAVPKSPRATALVTFGSRYTTRIFMHQGYALEIMPGDTVSTDIVRVWPQGGLPDRYTIAFRFHYPKNSPLWKIVGTEQSSFTVRTFGFDNDLDLQKNIGERLEVSGSPHYFENVPFTLGCCGGDWPPLLGERITLGATGQTADFESMLMVRLESRNEAELIEASPLMCEMASLDGAVGELSLSGLTQSLKSPQHMNVRGQIEIRESSVNDRMAETISGTINSATVDGRQLLPTRLDGLGSFWAGLLSTVLAALIGALIAKKGRLIRQWARK